MEENQNNQNTQTPKTPKWETWASMNKTPLLIIFLTLLTALLVVLAVSPKTNNPTSKTSSASQPQANLSLSSPTSLGNNSYQVNVDIDSAKLYATGTDLYLTYNPKTIGNVSVSKGSFIANPIELFNKVDPTTGDISYSINTEAGFKGTKGAGTIAVITFTVIGTPSGTTSINFGTNSDVTAQGTPKSVLGKSVGTTFDLSSLSTSSSSASSY